MPGIHLMPTDVMSFLFALPPGCLSYQSALGRKVLNSMKVLSQFQLAE